MMESEHAEYKTELLNIEEIKDHPRNYKAHPDDQIAHLCQNIKENGVYRNVVIAKDGTLLAGHAVVKACRKLEMKQVPVLRIDVDPLDVRALKLLAADNEISHLGVVDDRALSEMLKEVMSLDSLLGTGYDEKMLANLIFVTRPASEIQTLNEAAEWVGMPEFEPAFSPLKAVVQFQNTDDRAAFFRKLEIADPSGDRKTVSMWWPPKERNDLKSLQYEQAAEGAPPTEK